MAPSAAASSSGPAWSSIGSAPSTRWPPCRPLVSLRLQEYGLQWQHAAAVAANPLVDGRCALMMRDLDETASSLDQIAGGDGDRWREQRQDAGP